MKSRIRIPLGILIVVLSVAMLVGCATQTPTKAPTTFPTPDISKAVTLTWYMIGNGDEPDKDKVLAEVNAYLKTKINASIDLRTIGWGDYDNKMNPMLAAGEKFDLMFTSNWAANYLLNGSQGFYLEITDLLAKYGQDIEKTLGSSFLKASAINGKQYTMPTNKEKAHAWGVLLKKDLVTKYNVDVTKIKTYKDLEPIFDKIKTGETGVWPLLVVNAEAAFKNLDWDKVSDDNTPGALYSNNDAKNIKIINEFVAPESVTLYKQMREYYTKGYINPDAPTQTDFQAEMKSGKYFAINQSLKPGKDVEMSASTGVEWVQAYITGPVMSNRETTGAMLALPAACPNPERTIMLCNLLYTDAKLINLLDFGLEGQHYVQVKTGVIDNGPANKTTPPGYAPGNDWKYGNQFLTFLRAADKSTKWQDFDTFNKQALALKSLGFVYDGKNSSTQAAACKAVVAKYYVGLFDGSGTEPVDTIVANFKKELETAGVDALIGDMQKQFDTFLATRK